VGMGDTLKSSNNYNHFPEEGAMGVAGTPCKMASLQQNS